MEENLDKKFVKTCGNCTNMTNIADEERKNDNVMGGCFIDGHITFSDCKVKKCKFWENFYDRK